MVAGTDCELNVSFLSIGLHPRQSRCWKPPTSQKWPPTDPGPRATAAPSSTTSTSPSSQTRWVLDHWTMSWLMPTMDLVCASYSRLVDLLNSSENVLALKNSCKGLQTCLWLPRRSSGHRICFRILMIRSYTPDSFQAVECWIWLNVSRK